MSTIGNTFLEIVAASWDILLASSPFILFGFFVAGLLKGFIPGDFIEKHLGGRKKTGVLKAAFFGIPIPLCSCGVIPAAAGLRHQKASKGSVASFMISTPETGVDSIAITYALLDPVMTITRPIAAFVTATTTGLLVNMFDRDSKPAKKQASPGPGTILPMAPAGSAPHNLDCDCGDLFCSSSAKTPLRVCWDKLYQGMSFSFGALLREIGPWLLFGILLAALITVFISPEMIHSYLGGGIFSMLVMLALATPLYVCATASTPIAAALALKGLSPGAVLVFLLAGPATNMAALTVVARLLGRKTAFIYAGSIIVCSLIFGLVVNWFYFTMGLSISGWVRDEYYDSHGVLYVISALVLLVLIVWPWVGQWRRKKACSGSTSPASSSYHDCCGEK